MADIPSLRIGDTLKVPYTIEALIQDQPSNRPVRVDEGLWLRRELVEAAEHIPAPKPPLELGEWVYWGTRTRRYLVVCDQDSEYVRLASKGIADNRVERIELRRIDEAPE